MQNESVQLSFWIDAKTRREFRIRLAMEETSQAVVLRAAVVKFLAEAPTERSDEAA